MAQIKPSRRLSSRVTSKFKDTELAAAATAQRIDSAELTERFALVVFLLSQFNVHYLSWIKNGEHLFQYWQRFTPFFAQLHKLPEFDGLSWPLSEQAKWVICEAIKSAMLYRRKLFIRLSKLANVQYYVTNKKFRVMLSGGPCQADGNLNSDEEEEDSILPPTDENGRILLGELELEEGAKKWFVLPRSFNRHENDIKIHLVLVEDEENAEVNLPPKEYHQIVISEADISGFKGYSRMEQFEVDEEPFQLELNLKWQIHLHSFETMLPQPVAILRKLPGALFHLGMYYWHFFRDFYRWAATESMDMDTRYCAMQTFYEISTCLPVKCLAEDLASIFVGMYRGRYPSPDQVTVTVNENDYVPEPLSILENFIFVFQYLRNDEKIAFLARIRPFTGPLLRSRFFYFKRLLALVVNDLGNFESFQIEDVVLPVTIEAVYTLATVRSPEDELADARVSKLDWKAVQSLASQLTHLAVECVQHAKPLDWRMLPLEHPNMTSVRRCLSLLMRSLFNRTTIRFLKSIYRALMKHEALTEHQLASYLTKARLDLAGQWCADDKE